MLSALSASNDVYSSMAASALDGSRHQEDMHHFYTITAKCRPPEASLTLGMPMSLGVGAAADTVQCRNHRASRARRAGNIGDKRAWLSLRQRPRDGYAPAY